MKKLAFTLSLLLAFAGAQSTETLVQYLSGKDFDDAVEWEFFCYFQIFSLSLPKLFFTLKTIRYGICRLAAMDVCCGGVLHL